LKGERQATGYRLQASGLRPQASGLRKGSDQSKEGGGVVGGPVQTRYDNHNKDSDAERLRRESQQ
jgi:hypothetical protein